MAEPERRLHLLGETVEDATTISALLQDAVVPLSGICYDRPRRQLLLAGARFRWEAHWPSWISFGLRIGSVLHAERRNWPKDGRVPLQLLAIRPQDDRIELDFAGGSAVRAAIECLDLELDDFDSPWPAPVKPRHG